MPNKEVQRSNQVATGQQSSANGIPAIVYGGRIEIDKGMFVTTKIVSTLIGPIALLRKHTD